MTHSKALTPELVWWSCSKAIQGQFVLGSGSGNADDAEVMTALQEYNVQP